jgi:hypothetical protein
MHGRLARLSRLAPGLSGRVFVGTAAIVCAVLAAVLAVASASARRLADDAARRGLEQAADLTAQLLAGRGRSLAGGARVFVQGPYFRALVAERRRDDILDQSFEAAEQLEADWVFITDERGVLLAKSDEPGASGTQMGGIALVAGALEGRVTSGFGASRDSLLFQTVAVPIVVPGAAPVGTLTATRVVDAQLARDVRAATGTEVIFYTVDERGRRRAAASTLGRDTATALLPADGAAPGALRAGYLTHHAALVTVGGDLVGGFVVLRAHEPLPGRRGGRAALAAGRRCARPAARAGGGVAGGPSCDAARARARGGRAGRGARRLRGRLERRQLGGQPAGARRDHRARRRTPHAAGRAAREGAAGGDARERGADLANRSGARGSAGDRRRAALAARRFDAGRRRATRPAHRRRAGARQRLRDALRGAGRGRTRRRRHRLPSASTC